MDHLRFRFHRRAFHPKVRVPRSTPGNATGNFLAHRPSPSQAVKQARVYPHARGQTCHAGSAEGCHLPAGAASLANAAFAARAFRNLSRLSRRWPECSCQSNPPRLPTFTVPARRPAHLTDLKEKPFSERFSHNVRPGATGCASPGTSATGADEKVDLHPAGKPLPEQAETEDKPHVGMHCTICGRVYLISRCM